MVLILVSIFVVFIFVLIFVDMIVTRICREKDPEAPTQWKFIEFDRWRRPPALRCGVADKQRPYIFGGAASRMSAPCPSLITSIENLSTCSISLVLSDV